MANDLRGEVGFEALGKTWTMRLGNGAVRHIENETGKTFVQIGKELSDEKAATVSLLTVVFCAALLRNHPDVTMTVCDDLLDEIGHQKAGELLGEAFKLMQPKPAKGGSARPRKATAA